MPHLTLSMELLPSFGRSHPFTTPHVSVTSLPQIQNINLPKNVIIIQSRLWMTFTCGGSNCFHSKTYFLGEASTRRH